jgi:hypothetical protein
VKVTAPEVASPISIAVLFAPVISPPETVRSPETVKLPVVPASARVSNTLGVPALSKIRRLPVSAISISGVVPPKQSQHF